MNKLDFVIRQFSRIKKKRFESYVVNRIWHLINDIDIKPVTQQYVRRKGSFSLTDLYFPQLKLHIEVDEPHHERFYINDQLREADIIEATNHKVERIKIQGGIEDVNKKIDEIVLLITEEIEIVKKDGSFEPWDPNREFNPLFYIDKGYLDVNENPAFRRIVDAANCLGQNAKGYQRAFIPCKAYNDHYLWFPKLYKNGEWNNSLSEDGITIYEKPTDLSKLSQHLENVRSKGRTRIVFPRVVDNLGSVLYRFKGVFALDLDRSNLENGAIYTRIATRFEF